MGSLGVRLRYTGSGRCVEPSVNRPRRGLSTGTPAERPSTGSEGVVAVESASRWEPHLVPVCRSTLRDRMESRKCLVAVAKGATDSRSLVEADE